MKLHRWLLFITRSKNFARLGTRDSVSDLSISSENALPEPQYAVKRAHFIALALWVYCLLPHSFTIVILYSTAWNCKGFFVYLGYWKKMQKKIHLLQQTWKTYKLILVILISLVQRNLLGVINLKITVTTLFLL